MYASSSKYTEILKLLIKNKNVNFNLQNTNGETALIRASSENCCENLKLLLGCTNNVNIPHTYDNNALISSSFINNTSSIRILKDTYLNVNITDKYGNTALIWASFRRNTDCVKILLKNNWVNVNMKNKKGKTALMVAENYDEIVNLLLPYKHPINNKSLVPLFCLILFASLFHILLVIKNKYAFKQLFLTEIYKFICPNN